MIRYALENDGHDRGVEDELGTVGLQAWGSLWDYQCEMTGMVKQRWGGDVSGKREMEAKPAVLLLGAPASPSSPSAFTAEICVLKAGHSGLCLPRSAQNCYKAEIQHTFLEWMIEYVDEKFSRKVITLH